MSPPNRRLMVTVAFVLTVFAAMAANATVDVLQSGGDLGRFVSYTLDEARLIFLLSTGLVWLALVALVAVTGRLWLSVGALASAALAIGSASAIKIKLRQEPIYPSDLAFLGEAGFLTEMVEPGHIALVVGAVVLVLLVAVLVGRLAARLFPPVRRRQDPRLWRRLLVLRVVTLAVAVAGLAYAAQFNEPGNKVRAAYESAGAHWAFWYQQVNYARHGFVAGYLYNLDVPAMVEPEGYGARAMARVSRKYGAVADRLNADRSPTAVDDVNVVVVLSEAFTDPTSLKGVGLAEDPIPFTRSLMSTTRSGEMLAQLFGGGTANMEFEALTGFSLSQFLPQMNSPYQMLVPETPTFPSAVGYFRAQGHDAVAVHPYMTSMYKRYAVYPTLGFSDFVHESTMGRTERIEDNQFVSDASAFDEVRELIESSPEPMLLNVVTMQNHYPMAGNYSDPVGVRGVEGQAAEQLAHYARGLRHTDDALKELITSLERSDERTAVVFYGDHAPAFWDGEVYEENGDQAFRRTPYFLWTNFESLSDTDEPVTSPIYFLPSLLDALGAPLPPYYALLRELHREIPAMEQGEYYLPDGRLVTERELPDAARAVLDDYRMVQYDLAVGERYAQDALFYPDAPG